MIQLWASLNSLYGSRFEKEYGEVGGETFIAWCGALKGFTPDQIRRGLDSLLAEGSEFTPNLIKFLRLCRTAAPYSDHAERESLPKPKPRYSVMRIEQAKQQFLFGESFEIPRSQKHIVDWTREDEETLLAGLAEFTPHTPLEEVNARIDFIEFSHGRQIDNAYGEER